MQALSYVGTNLREAAEAFAESERKGERLDRMTVRGHMIGSEALGQFETYDPKRPKDRSRFLIRCVDTRWQVGPL